MSAPAGPGGRTSAARTVGLVARREFDTRVRTRSFLIGLLVTILLLGGVTVLPALLAGDGAVRLGYLAEENNALAQPLRAAAEAAEVDLGITDVPDEAAARDRLAAGDLDAALLPDGDGYRLLVQSEEDPALSAVVQTAVAQVGVGEVLAEQGVDPAALAAAGRPVRLDQVDPPDPQAAERTGIAFVVVLLLYVQLLTFGIAVAMGVVEEKSSRVVEVLLATIRPWQLLLGKVLGIGAAGLVQLVVLGAVGLAAGTATGVITLTGTAVSVFLASLGWFLLGFLFFAVLYAAAGSLVSRQEEINAVTTPMTVLILVPFLVAVSTVDDPGDGLASTLSVIPPFSPILMPIQQAAGEATGAETALAVVLMLAATALFTVLGGRIYAGAVLRTGSRVRLRDAFRSS